METLTKTNWQKFAFALLASITVMLSAQTQGAAQSTTQSNHSLFNYFSSSSSNQTLHLSSAIGNFNQDEKDYPKPDFSAMEKWYEIVKYEYDFFTEPLLPRLYFVVKPKIANPPTYFKMKFADKDGVALSNYQVWYSFSN